MKTFRILYKTFPAYNDQIEQNSTALTLPYSKGTLATNEGVVVEAARFRASFRTCLETSHPSFFLKKQTKKQKLKNMIFYNP